MENEILEISLDTEEAEENLDLLIKSLRGLQVSLRETGAMITKAFAQLQRSTKKAESSINAMTTALENAVATLKDLAKLLEEVESGDQWAQEVADGYESILAVIGTIAGVAGTLLAAGVAASTVGIVAVVMAVVSLIVAAIVAIVEHWEEIVSFFTQTLPDLWSQFVGWISSIASTVAEAFSNAMVAIGGFFSDCWNGVVAVWNVAAQWMQENVIQPIIEFFTPIVEWFAELFRSIWQTVSDILYNIGVIVTGCGEIIRVVWEAVAQFFADLWIGISAWAIGAWNDIQAVFVGIATWFSQNVIQPVADFFSGLWEGFANKAKEAWEGVKTVFGAVVGFFGKIFGDAWAGIVNIFSAAGSIFTDIKDGILTAFKNIINGIITGINNVVAVPFNGINFAIEKIRDINILGITPFAGLKTINVPQIPYLAKGAVLPANRPFLAMVGDQRHGTNIEAPLATIQEAVALVMEDLAAQNAAGQRATVEMLRNILEAVLGIQIGDDVIGRAASRYNRKMAIARGGH